MSVAAGGVSCPPDVEQALRAAGWKGRKGYWFHPMFSGARRWWDAYYQVRTMPRMRRCARTLDIFNNDSRQ